VHATAHKAIYPTTHSLFPTAHVVLESSILGPVST